MHMVSVRIYSLRPESCLHPNAFFSSCRSQALSQKSYAVQFFLSVVFLLLFKFMLGNCVRMKGYGDK